MNSNVPLGSDQEKWYRKISLSFKQRGVRTFSFTPAMQPSHRSRRNNTYQDIHTNFSDSYTKQWKRCKRKTNLSGCAMKTFETKPILPIQQATNRLHLIEQIQQNPTYREFVSRKTKHTKLTRRPHTIDNGVLARRSQSSDYTLVQQPINEVYIAFTKVGENHMVPIKDDVLARLRKRWKKNSNANLVSSY